MPSPRETVGLTVCVKETRSQTFKTLKPFIFSICCDGYSFYIADPEERPVCLLQRWKDCLTLRRVTLATVILMSWAFQCIKNPVYESCPLMPACGFLMPENDTSWLHASWSCIVDMSLRTQGTWFLSVNIGCHSFHPAPQGTRDHLYHPSAPRNSFFYSKFRPYWRVLRVWLAPEDCPPKFPWIFGFVIIGLPDDRV